MRKITPMKAIRLKCLDCCCGSAMEVRLCTAKNCPLYTYKSGHRPKEGSLSANTTFTEKSEASPQFFEKEPYTEETDNE